MAPESPWVFSEPILEGCGKAGAMPRSWSPRLPHRYDDSNPYGESSMAPSLEGMIGRELAEELTQAFGRIQHCLNQLSEEQVWHRPRMEMNSIGNLLLHLAGNVRQWIIGGLGGETDTRNRPAEFAERGPISKAELLGRLESTVDEAKIILETQTADTFRRKLRIQAFDTTGFGAALHSVSHFRGHTQEIIHQTREILGANYQFAWLPQTKEQGAAV
jgi:Protein of unknown function (DUF1572)